MSCFEKWICKIEKSDSYIKIEKINFFTRVNANISQPTGTLLDISNKDIQESNSFTPNYPIFK